MNIKEKYTGFKEWQKTPFQVAPMVEEDHECATCGTEFTGNYCPRCGQSAKVEPRMSGWKTFLLVLDVWGLGNRGMFRTLRDLILRPGYLICDYLQGKRGAYFPPFKLLFLLTTLSLVVAHGFNIFHENFQVDRGAFKFRDEELYSDGQAPIFEGLTSWVNYTAGFQRDYPAIFQLIFMCFAGYFFYLFFKKSNILGKLTFSEFFIGLVYMVDMYIIYSIVLQFFGYFGIKSLIWSSVFLVYLIPLKQLSGYGTWKTIWRAFCGLCLSAFAFLIFLLIVFFLAYAIFQQD